jgi:hypothetical protein
MAEAKTQPTTRDPRTFLEALDEPRRSQCLTLLDLMERVSGQPAVMWGAAIVGFGSYHYVYASGRTGDWPRTGFSPRKQDLTVYIVDGFAGREGLLAALGKHKTGASCLYLKNLESIDLAALESLVRASLDHMETLYPSDKETR